MLYLLLLSPISCLDPGKPSYDDDDHDDDRKEGDRQGDCTDGEDNDGDDDIDCDDSGCQDKPACSSNTQWWQKINRIAKRTKIHLLNYSTLNNKVNAELSFNGSNSFGNSISGTMIFTNYSTPPYGTDLDDCFE